MLRIARFVAVASLLACAACSPQPQSPPAEPPATSAEVSAVVVTRPAAGARVTSPLVAEGTATGDWFFEAQFPARLIAADGTVLAEAPAQALSNWMTEAPVPFRTELAFTVTQETQATLVLEEDMPADNTAPRQVSVAVVLAPAR